MPRTIISDTSCFIVLDKIGELELLRKTYGEVFTTSEVADEYGQPLPDWVVIKSASDKYRQRILEMQIDKGEASAIALALEVNECTVILDDDKARKIAVHLGLHITGTIGVIIRAKLTGAIVSIRPILEKIRQTDFRFSPELEKIALRIAGESIE